MAEADAFIKKVNDELRDMGKKEAKLHRDAEAIRQQLSQIRQRRTELDRSLGVYRDVMGVGQEGAASAFEEASADETIADVAHRILTQRGGSMPVPAIVRELKALGKLKGGGTSGRADYATTYQAIRRDDRFAMSQEGVRLAEAVPSEPEPPA